MNSWANIKTIAKRELAAYFSSPLAYVFIVIFLLLCGFFTFLVYDFFGPRGRGVNRSRNQRSPTLKPGRVGGVVPSPDGGGCGGGERIEVSARR